jgi:uncharacterized membrane protein YdbT with pleckstrin-like domain
VGRYVQENLLPGEEVIHESRVSNIVYLPYGILILFLVGIGFVVGMEQKGYVFWLLAVAVAFIAAVVCGIRKASTEVAVTNKRLILKTGFVRRETVEQFLEKIDSISVSQSIMERVVNAGTIVVRGSGESFSPVRGIDEPLQFRKMVNEQVDRTKQGKK